ncbi:MAG: hypothetical protein ACRCYS_04825 [Beijerinckiaceae bacterium]
MSIRQLPFMAFAVLAYFVLHGLMGLGLETRLIGFFLPSADDFRLTLGEGLVALTAVLLFVEMLNSTNANTSAILNHGLSMLLFLACAGLFLFVPRFGTGPFFVMTVLVFIDVIAGYSISILRARRDLTVDRAVE